MFNNNLEVKKYWTLGVAIFMGITAFIGYLNDKNQAEQIENLIEKVEILTKERSN